MQQTRHTPTFNMKAVVQETGLKPDTLRAWERRYNLPRPERTEGGHRLYSQRDIDTLKWLIARQEEGLSISHAVELWDRIESQGQDPLLVESATAVPVEPSPRIIAAGETIAQLRQAWVSACMSFDEQAAEQVLAQAFALYPPEQVCFDLLQKGLAEVGEGWYEGETTVQQEHFASELANRRLEALVAATPAPTRQGRILIGCPPGEEHTFSPLLLTLLLRRRGWEVLYLGANVPMDRLEMTLSSTRPQLVIYSAQQLYTASTLMDVALLLRALRVPFAYGGRIFNSLPAVRARIPGHFLGEDLETTTQTVETVLTTPQPVPKIIEPSPSYIEALDHFRDRQALVETAVWQQLHSSGIPYAQLVNANVHLARDIMAALALGDMDFLGSEFEWIAGLMQNYGVNSGQLPEYLRAYRNAAEQHLDERAQPVQEWLARFRLPGA